MTLKARHSYSPWRHGGWYVHSVRHPSGACGCVSNNYPDGKWRIACYADGRPFDDRPTFKTREAAANAELALVQAGGGFGAPIKESAR